MAEQPSMQDILKAVENMQSSMQDTQERLSNTKVTGSAAINNTNLTVELTGKFQCMTVSLPNDFQTINKAGLEALIGSAINDAVNQVEDLTRNQIKSLSEDLEQKNKE
jgi:DNA-binding protein YbaB